MLCKMCLDVSIFFDVSQGMWYAFTDGTKCLIIDVR